MEPGLKEAMTNGVFVEFCDVHGHTIGQAVYTPWQGRPVPSLGDTMCCAVVSPTTGRRGKLLGRVVRRHFELQHEANGHPCVWVRLLVETHPKPATARTARGRVPFSAN